MCIDDPCLDSQSGSAVGANRLLRAGSCGLLLACSAVLIPVAQADVGVSGTVEYLENAARFAESDSDVMRAASIDANFARETNSFDVIFDYAAYKEDFRKDIQFDREYVDGAGTVIWKQIPDTLNWRLSNRRSNQIINAQVPEVANNQQIVNVNAIGPTLDLQLGATNFLNLSAEYAEADYDRSSRLDNDRTNLSGTFGHAFSEILTASAVFTTTETRFDSSFDNLDYDLTSISGRLTYNRANLNVELEIGEYTIDRSSAPEQNEPLQSLSATYQLNTRNSVSLTTAKSVQDLVSDATRWFGYQLTDTGEFGEQVPAYGSSEVGSVYIIRSDSASYRYNDEGNMSFSLNYRDEDRDYQGTQRREQWETLSANFGMPLGQRLFLNVELRQSDLQFSQLSQPGFQDRRDAIVGLVYRMNQQLTFRMQVSAGDQESDAFTDYDDSGALISASYRFGDW